MSDAVADRAAGGDLDDAAEDGDGDAAGRPRAHNIPSTYRCPTTRQSPTIWT